jgi:hypothetical protein
MNILIALCTLSQLSLKFINTKCLTSVHALPCVTLDNIRELAIQDSVHENL